MGDGPCYGVPATASRDAVPSRRGENREPLRIFWLGGTYRNPDKRRLKARRTTAKQLRRLKGRLRRLMGTPR